MQSHILLIGFTAELAASLGRTLSQQEYQVSQTTNDTADILKVQQLRPDLVLMNLSTANQSDLAPCRQLFSLLPNTPIMLLGNDDIQDQIASLNVCALDYLSIPFAAEELLARIRAKLRRASWDTKKEILVFADLRLDAQTHEVHFGKQLIELTAKEFDLLKYLMTNPQQVLSQQQILDEVWSDALLTNESNIVQVYMRTLRQKLGAAEQFIQTIRGVGYILKAPDSATGLLAS
ncbi:MAG: response regulator transcription factor [Cyanobacteria bacterium J06626_18]